MIDIKETLAQLVAIETTTGKNENFEKVFEFLNSYFEPLGLKKYEYDNKGTISMVWTNSDNILEPEILLSAHIDVVPAERKLFKMDERDGKLFGRGVSDMKSGVVSFISVLQRLGEVGKMPKSMAVMITTDEEEGGIEGTNYLVNKIGYRPKLVVLPDGGEDFNLVVGSKGVLQLKATTVGNAGHAAYPWLGESSNDRMVSFLSQLRSMYPQPTKEVWENTVNIGQIHGGTQTNQIADITEAKLDFRLIPQVDVDSIIEDLQIIDTKVEIKKMVVADAFEVDIENPNVKLWQKVVEAEIKQKSKIDRDHGASDARFFSPFGIPVIMTKPQAGGDHSPEEWLNIESWQQFNEILYKFLVASMN